MNQRVHTQQHAQYAANLVARTEIVNLVAVNFISPQFFIKK